jgi:hypothetical protein
MARAQSLIGIPGPDGHTLTARLLKQGRAPERMLPLLRRIWRDVFDGDTHRFTDRLLAQDWTLLDPTAPARSPQRSWSPGSARWTGAANPTGCAWTCTTRGRRSDTNGCT